MRLTELANEILAMSSANIIERFAAKLDALRESNQATRWLLGIGMTIIGLIVAYGTFFRG